MTPRLDGVTYLEKPPLFYWLQTASIHLFGLGEWSMRLWTALFALAGVLATYAAGRLLFDRRTGLLSAAVLGTSFLYYGMSRVVTLDMAVSVLISLTLLTFLVALRFPMGPARRYWMWLAYLLAAAAVMTKGLIGIVLPMLVIGVWILILNRWRLLTQIYLGSGLLLFFLAATPWHVLVQMHHPEFLHYYFIHQHFERYLTHISHRPGPPWYFVGVTILGFLPWTPFLPQALMATVPLRSADRDIRDTELFLALWAFLILVFFSVSDSKLIPYILPIFPALALLTGRYFSKQWDQRESRGLRAGYWALALTLGVLAVAVFRVPTFRPSLHPMLLAHFMHALSVLLVLTGLAVLWSGLRHGVRAAFPAALAGFVLFLVTLNAAMPALDVRSIKPLALVLKQQLRPQDEVATYDDYWQDLPFYLRRTVTLVHWQGELAEGLAHEDDSAWVIGRATFWRQWASARRVYVLMSRAEYERLRARGKRMYVIAQNPYNVIACNQNYRSLPTSR